MSSHVAGTNINRLRFDLDVAAIKSQSEELLQKYKAVYDQVAAVPLGSQTYANTVKPIADFEPDFDTLASNFTFPTSVSTDKAIRDASSDAQKAMSAFGIEQSMREDVYKVVTEYSKKGEKLENPQDQRFLDRVLRDFRRNGLHLPETEREQVKSIKKKISDLSIQFQKNVNEENTKLKFTKQQLEGLPESVLKRLATEKEGDETYYLVTMKYPDIFPALKYVKNVDVRKDLDRAFSSRCKEENTPILEEIAQLRHQLAQILGYPTHAEFVLEIRMAKKSQNVKDFYAKLLPKLQTLGKQELQVLEALKKEDTKSEDNKIHNWDYQYYDRLLNETKYSVDDEKIKEYFPLGVVVDRTLEVYQELLGLSFQELHGVHVWHPEVQAFEVKDKQDGSLVGHFYLDLFPREGKYAHAAAFALQKGCVKGDGSWQYPTSAMVCNFVKPLPDSPSLLKHSEVETFFHEFGHIMHGLCAKARHSRFAGTSTERDFVECPSQMLENWCWDKKMLQRLSKHYQSGGPLPDDIIDLMIAAKNVNSGLFNLRQMFYGIFDQTLHSQGKSDAAALYNKLRGEISLVDAAPDTNGSASFGHIVGGYDASYYGYLWSKVFSSDMFEAFEKAGIMDPGMGKKYREKVLQPGGSRDGDDILRDFLGRDPVMDPFMRSIGLSN